MSVQPATYTCDGDGCGAVKGEVNHWWLVFPVRDEITISAWNEEEARDTFYLHACGEACLHKIITKLTQQISGGQ